MSRMCNAGCFCPTGMWLNPISQECVKNEDECPEKCTEDVVLESDP